MIAFVLVFALAAAPAPCASDDAACLEASLLQQTYELEAARLREEHLRSALDYSQREKAALEKQNADRPSRLTWFLVGVGATIATSIGLAIATHK